MKKTLCEIFPDRIIKIRSQRGTPPYLKLNSSPSLKEFFENIENKLIAYLEEDHSDSTHTKNLKIKCFYYDEKKTDKFGLLSNNWCLCDECDGGPINSCRDSGDLNYLILKVVKKIHWYSNLEFCLSQLCVYTHNMNFIEQVIRHFYSNEIQIKYALLAQKKLIKQREEHTQLGIQNTLSQMFQQPILEDTFR